MKKSKTFYIESLGCAKNQVDSEILIENLIKAGWVRKDEPRNAELILVNTCGFIEEAKQESIETALGFKAEYSGKKVMVTGCLSQRYKDELKDGLKELDGFFGNKALEKITDISERVLNGERVSYFPEDHEHEPDYYKRDYLLSLPGSAYVKISEGCDNGCTFCAIPIIRGRLKSRTIGSLMEEIKYLLDKGVFEINLIAQDLGSFGKDRGGLMLKELLNEITSLRKDFWLRLLYFYPDRFNREIFSTIKSDKRILPYFDLPFQHASKNVLARMGRLGNKDKYLNLIESIRKYLPDAVIRSTFLVGFPGETDEDFEILKSFQKKAQIDWLGVFVYSKEEGTAASYYKGAVPKKLALERKRIIEVIQENITVNRLRRFSGKRLKVLIEEEIKNENIYIGRAYLQAPEVDGAVVVKTGAALNPGDVITAVITGNAGVDLEAVF